MGSNDKSKQLRLDIANLSLIIDASDISTNITLPKCHQKFLNIKKTEDFFPSVFFKHLKLDVINSPKQYSPCLINSIVKTDIWELWLDENNNYVFFQPQQLPIYWIKINKSFSFGEIIGSFSVQRNGAYYPLRNLDMTMYVNWLANFGDLILHASGIAYDGYGYAFIGESGKGKSTLVENLYGKDGVSVLGEDQVILRFLDGEFWIFGTPWHLEPRMCSPVGVPLKHVFFLDRKLNFVTQRMNPFDAVVNIMRTAFVPYYLPQQVSLILQRLDTFSRDVDCYSLSYKLGSDILPNIIDP